MAKAIPMIITNNNILVKHPDSHEFCVFSIPGLHETPNIPFYHQYASKIAQSQSIFKSFLKEMYGKHLGKYVLAIIVPDDTSRLEQIFINEFFLNSGACKAVAQMKMCQALSKDEAAYISISKTMRNVVLQYVKSNEIIASKFYDASDYSIEKILEDSKRIHIDVEYNNPPVYINNFEMNLDDFSEFGIAITPKAFMEKIASIDIEKI